MRKPKTTQDTQNALQDLVDAFVRARAMMDGNDLDTWKVLLRYETKINELKQKIKESV